MFAQTAQSLWEDFIHKSRAQHSGSSLHFVQRQNSLSLKTSFDRVRSSRMIKQQSSMIGNIYKASGD